MKSCPKCSILHERPGRFCSRHCANSRSWSEADKRKKSDAAKRSVKVIALGRTAFHSVRSDPDLERRRRNGLNYYHESKARHLWETGEPAHGPTEAMRRIVFQEQHGRCLLCGLGNAWNDRALVLELDHINGRRFDQRRENLRYLCPNCHSQTDTYRRKNVAYRTGL